MISFNVLNTEPFGLKTLELLSYVVVDYLKRCPTFEELFLK